MMASLYDHPIYKMRNSVIPLAVFHIALFTVLGSLEYQNWLPTWVAILLSSPSAVFAAMQLLHAYLRLAWATRTYKSQLPILMRRMLKLFPRLARCRTETAKIALHLILAALGLISAVHFDVYSPIFLSAFLLGVALTATLRVLLPPGGVYLAASSPARIQLFSQLSIRTIPAFAALLDVSNLVNPDKGSTEYIRGAMGVANDYRTSDPDDWTLVVRQLIEMTAIVLVDGRDETPGVRFEVDRLLRNRLDFKTIFLSADGTFPPVLRSLSAKSTHPSGNFQIMTPDVALQAIPLIIRDAGEFWLPVRMDA